MLWTMCRGTPAFALIETKVCRRLWNPASGALCFRPSIFTEVTIPALWKILPRWCWIFDIPRFRSTMVFASPRSGPISGRTYPVRRSFGVCMSKSDSTLWIGTVIGFPFRYFLVLSGMRWMIDLTMSTSLQRSLQQSPRRIPVYMPMAKRHRHSNPSREAMSMSRASSSTVSSRLVCESSGRSLKSSHGLILHLASSISTRCISRRTQSRWLYVCAEFSCRSLVRYASAWMMLTCRSSFASGKVSCMYSRNAPQTCCFPARVVWARSLRFSDLSYASHTLSRASCGFSSSRISASCLSVATASLTLMKVRSASSFTYGARNRLRNRSASSLFLVPVDFATRVPLMMQRTVYMPVFSSCSPPVPLSRLCCLSFPRPFLFGFSPSTVLSPRFTSVFSPHKTAVSVSSLSFPFSPLSVCFKDCIWASFDASACTEAPSAHWTTLPQALFSLASGAPAPPIKPSAIVPPCLSSCQNA